MEVASELFLRVNTGTTLAKSSHEIVEDEFSFVYF